jgi:hypothetical protein
LLAIRAGSELKEYKLGNHDGISFSAS